MVSKLWGGQGWQTGSSLNSYPRKIVQARNFYAPCGIPPPPPTPATAPLIPNPMTPPSLPPAPQRAQRDGHRPDARRCLPFQCLLGRWSYLQLCLPLFWMVCIFTNFIIINLIFFEQIELVITSNLNSTITVYFSNHGPGNPYWPVGQLLCKGMYGLSLSSDHYLLSSGHYPPLSCLMGLGHPFFF